MIQRIQSVYLLVASIILALMFAFPLMSYYGDLHTYQLSLLNMKSLVPDTQSIFSEYFTLPLLALVVFIAVLSIFNIFKFTDRKLQMKLARICIFGTILLIIALFVGYSRYIQSIIEVTEEFKIGAFLPVVSLLLFILAFRGIKKDDELVRSADRLR